MKASHLSVAKSIGPTSDLKGQTMGRHVFFVASSFEPRSTKSVSLIEAGAFSDAIVFNYQDTLDSVSGRFHAQIIRETLRTFLINDTYVLPCSFKKPYSVVHALAVFLEAQKLKIDCVTIDITCFTKLHLLLLLRYLQDDVGVSMIRICYTEPLTYATAYGRTLSYGTTETLSLPYKAGVRRSNKIALMAFMGHERARLERILQELEPDIAVVILGTPGFSSNMLEYSEKVNQGLIMRASFDRQYRFVKMPVLQPCDVYLRLLEEMKLVVSEHNCETVYFATMGTKLQALAVDMIRRSKEIDTRLLLAYSMPERYERNLYSQGSGRTYVGMLYG